MTGMILWNFPKRNGEIRIPIRPFLKASKKDTLYDTGTDVYSDEKLMTLVTCDTRDGSKRVVIIAKEVTNHEMQWRFLKVHQSFKSSEYKNYVISYALKGWHPQFLAYDRIDQESIIEVVIGKKTEFSNVQDWDFNIDDYLFYDLENGYSLVYMPPMEHYNVWQVIYQENEDSSIWKVCSNI